LLIGGVAVSRREGSPRAFFIVTALISTFGFIAGFLSFRYRLTVEGIELREGVFTRRQRNIALARISHINTHQNALARLIGVVRLEIQTEGGGAPEASFAALTLAAAEQIRQYIGDVGSVQANERTVYAASLRDRLVAGATTLQIGGVVAMALVVWRLLRRVQPGEGVASGAAPEFLSGVTGLFEELLVTISASPTLMALSIAALLLGIWGLSIALALMRWYGFRIIATENGAEFNLQSGVLSRHRTVINRHRVQAVEVRANIVRNLLGLVQIALVAAGSGQRGRARSRVFIPITSHDRARDYLNALWPHTGEDVIWQPVHRYYRRQHINRGMLLLLIAILTAMGTLALNVLTIVATTLVTLSLAWAIWRTATPSFNRTGYALRDGYLYVRRGAVSPRLWIVEASRIQAVIVTQNFMQQRKGVMSVVIDVNGLANNQRIVIPNLPTAQAEKLQMTLTPRARSATTVTREMSSVG